MSIGQIQANNEDKLHAVLGYRVRTIRHGSYNIDSSLMKATQKPSVRQNDPANLECNSVDSKKEKKIGSGSQFRDSTGSWLKARFGRMKEPVWTSIYWTMRWDRKLRKPRESTTPAMYRPGVHIMLWVTVVTILAIGLYVILIPRLSAPGDSGLDGVQVILAILAALGAVFLGVYAYRRQRLQEVASARDDQVQFLSRYNAATAQIADDKAAARLAGVYAMTHLADDWHEQRQQCVDVLCAYLRMPPTTDLGDEEVRSTILRVIIERLRFENHPYSWSDLAFNFDRVEFHDLNMSGTIFYGSEVSFQGAKFHGITNFSHTMFDTRVRFDGAHFTGPLIAFNFASFGGNVASFRNTAFASDITSFTGCLFQVNAVWFDGATFDSNLTTFLAGTFYGGHISFNSAVFGSLHTDFEVVTFDGYITFRGSRFVNTQATFAQVNFTESITLEKASLQNCAVRFDNTLIEFGEHRIGLEAVIIDNNSSISIDRDPSNLDS